MDYTAEALTHANTLYNRASSSNTTSQPPVYKAVGITLAITSGVFIGVSFVLKKTGLLKANVKYNEEAGEGYGYLKNFWWWTGMTLMIVGEICNFVAYAFVDAILVTPMGALSVVVTTILSAIFLKERLSFVGKIGCFNCIIGSVVIALNAPQQSSVTNIQDMQHFVIAPGFLTYAGIIIVGCLFIALWVAPRYGNKSMFVYLTICSLIGGLSVVATQGLGAAILAQVRGQSQFTHWFLYVLLVFVIGSLVTEIIYLNKALNIFNAAMVTPTYYVIFTSATIVTSAVLFQGFKGTAMAIVTIVMGFLTICSGVVLLQLSRSAKDVPDAAVFKGDLDQVREVGEQEASETEPKADAIRGAAAIIRRISVARQKMEQDEAKKYFQEKQEDQQHPPAEDEIIEWDGLRRRRTVVGDHPVMTPRSGRSVRTPRPPLGMSHFPDEEEQQPARTPSGGYSFLDDVRSRASTMLHPSQWRPYSREENAQPSPMHPVALTEIAVGQKNVDTAYQGSGASLEPPFQPHSGRERSDTPRSIAWADEVRPEAPASRNSSLAPDPPPHTTRRQFSFQTVFKRMKSAENSPRSPGSPTRGILKHNERGSSSHGPRRAVKNATEEERLGLVQGDSRTTDANDGYLDEKLSRSSSPDLMDEALEEVRQQYARPHQPSAASSISTTAFPPYEDMHHHYHPEVDHHAGYATVRRVSSPNPFDDGVHTTTIHHAPESLHSARNLPVQVRQAGRTSSLPPIPAEEPGSEYVHVAAMEGQNYSSPELEVTSVASTSPPPPSRHDRGDSRYRRRPAADHSSPSNSDSSHEGSGAATRRLVPGNGGAFI